MSFSNPDSAHTNQKVARMSAESARVKDAELRARTIVGDADAHWLIRQIEGLQRRSGIIRSGTERTYHFLPDDAEVVLNSAVDGYTVITMPAGCIISRTDGTCYRDWVFRVENGRSGSQHEYFEMRYRRIATDAHMLCLTSHGRGERSRK